MKNILIVDDGYNCAYDVFSVSEEIFTAIFPNAGQDIEFIEDVEARLGDRVLADVFEGFWSNPVKKREVNGIHGILFYGLKKRKEKFYPNKRDSDLDGWARGWISDPSAPKVDTTEFRKKIF